MNTRYMAWLTGGFLLPLLMLSCADGTDTLGVYPEGDAVSNSEGVYDVYTQSAALRNVVANSTTCYLGKVTDPETGKQITANFAAQFQTFENYKFPDRGTLDEQLCDSVEIRLFISDTFGDTDNPMKLEVYALDSTNIMSEDSTYYTNTDLWKYVAPGAEPIATKVFTSTDYIVSEAERTSSTYAPSIRVVLPREYGERMMQKYYDHPEYYKDSYTFIRNVCPGFFFRIKSGTGTMINLEVGTLNINFHYHQMVEVDDSTTVDSTFSALCRFASTPEVIQSTQFDNDDYSDLVADGSCTYLKTPAGICTEVTLPIDEIYASHPTDSISKAQLTLTRINNWNTAEKNYSLGIPETVLLVRKTDATRFFSEHDVADAQTSYTTALDETYNTYTFSNLSRLVAYCQNEKQQAMQEQNLTEAEWEAAHPDWNKVLVIPVDVTTSTDTYGNTYQVSVNHDMEMNSTRLVRGTRENPIKLQVIYSNFQ